MRFTLNGAEVDVDAHPMARLLDVLRIDLRLTGTKEGCGEGECGACTVLIDGQPVCSCLVPVAQAEGTEVLSKPVCSCLVPVAQAEGTEVLSIEGLGDDHPLQHLFMNEVGAQCGICTPGMILAALSLGPTPTLDDVKIALAGNLCRCTGYSAIYRAVMKWRGLDPDADAAVAELARP
jgi:aerobic-type carbon monoxide dehydrogenase small subunit (CoxS/CutS family)